jgi:acetoin utilization protein AcuB
MVKDNVRRGILVDKNKNVKGIVTVTDLIRFISDQIIRNGEGNIDILKTKAKDFAETDVITVNANESVAHVADLLVEKKMGGVPVVDDQDHLVGVFTERDILKLIGTYNLI